MVKLLIVLTIFLTLILSFVFSNKSTPTATIDNKIFILDVAKTDIQKGRGLSIYNSLPINKGMVFPFQKSDYYAFWMKDMKFPIDIIYINKNKIVDIFKNVPAPKSQSASLPIIKPKNLSDTVLEINAELSDKYNFKIGDLVKISY